MPLNYACEGETNIIRKVGGTPEVKQHLADMGFNVGESVSVICTLGGIIIVKVKEARVAISRELASKIMV